jgi:tripartite-type tricarboxylate transporter receptor subunit TctC
MSALLGGHIQLADSNLTQSSKVKAGQLKFLAIMSARRNTEIPDVPTLKELGYDVDYAVNRGIMVPHGTPRDVEHRLMAACEKAAKDPAFAKAMKLQGTEVNYLDAGQYAAFLKKDDATTKEITQQIGMLKQQ